MFHGEKCIQVFISLNYTFPFALPVYTKQSILEPIFRYKKCDIIPEYTRYASPHNKYHLKYGNIFLPPRVVLFTRLLDIVEYLLPRTSIFQIY